MQATRRRILEILKEHGRATVEELSQRLSLTPVTVRHHLDVLRGEGLIEPPVVRHRATPGRPQYTFCLSQHASEFFPKNFDVLSSRLLDSIRASLDQQQVNVVFEGVTQRFLHDAPAPAPGETAAQTLDRVAAFLDRNGYVAHWERVPEGFMLHTSNCPYEGCAADHPELCAMDLALVSALLGAEPQRTGRLVEGCSSCSYLIRDTDFAAA